MKAREVNFDGLVGLTHHYAGLSFGNEASTRHRFQVSNPRLAAKQGLLKMKALADAGFPQAVIPPHDIDVTTGHTEAAPLDLTTAMPPGGPVLTPSEYAELNGRLTILEAGGLAGVGVRTVWSGSQAAYDAITTPDADTLYFVTG